MWHSTSFHFSFLLKTSFELPIDAWILDLFLVGGGGGSRWLQDPLKLSRQPNKPATAEAVKDWVTVFRLETFFTPFSFPLFWIIRFIERQKFLPANKTTFIILPLYCSARSRGSKRDSVLKKFWQIKLHKRRPQQAFYWKKAKRAYLEYSQEIFKNGPASFLQNNRLESFLQIKQNELSFL